MTQPRSITTTGALAVVGVLVVVNLIVVFVLATSPTYPDGPAPIVVHVEYGDTLREYAVCLGTGLNPTDVVPVLVEANEGSERLRAGDTLTIPRLITGGSLCPRFEALLQAAAN